MENPNIYHKMIMRALLTDREEKITAVKNLRNIYSALLDRDNYQSILGLLKEKKFDHLPKDILPTNGSFREYLEVYTFLNQDGSEYIATVYDSDELWQDPQIIDIISV